MQCDAKCSEYSPCVAACPPKTCENRLVYDRATSLCADDSCVEGEASVASVASRHILFYDMT